MPAYGTYRVASMSGDDPEQTGEAGDRETGVPLRS
jgi:hypothetical protein